MTACRYINFALSIYMKSMGLYDQVRETGYMPLPSKRLLASYMQNGTNTPGWRWEEILRLHQLYADRLGGDLRLGGLVFDAMKILAGLVYSTSTRKLVGFTDIGDAALQSSLADVLDAETDLEGACHEPTLVGYYYHRIVFLRVAVTVSIVFIVGISVALLP